MSSETHTEIPPLLQLFVRRDKVGRYPQPPKRITSDEMANTVMKIETPVPIETETTAGPPPTTPPVLMCLLHGLLGDFLPYIGQQQSKWLLDIAHDICDPHQKRGLLVVWDFTAAKWSTVHPADPLIPSMYIYKIQGDVFLSLTKISDHREKLKGNVSGSATTMANHVSQRDNDQCWVTGYSYSTVNSHVCPKQMGDHVFHVVYSTFVSRPAPPTLSINDDICGITLSRNIDTAFDKYELGLQLVDPV